MNRTISKVIGVACVVTTALALSTTTQASSKNKHRKPSVNERGAQSFRYNNFRSNGNLNRQFNNGRFNRNQLGNGQSGLGSFRYNAFRSSGFGNGNSQIGFPFKDSFGLGDGGATAQNTIQSGNNGNSIVVNEGPAAPLGLQITGTRVQQRPPAKVIQVSHDLKTLGEERAERQADRLNSHGDERVFRFYRENEAYDVRFPSVVYLKSD